MSSKTGKINQGEVVAPRDMSNDLDTSDHVAILMCTFNGAAFLEDQLTSIEQQTHANWSLWVSDDGSSDDTVQIIERFASRVGTERVHFLRGPSQGFANNFFSLMGKVPLTSASYYAFADQDDVWLAPKLASAIMALKPHQNHMALYAGPTIYIDEHNQVLGHSTVFLKPACFTNALVQSIGGGNTMMINQSAFALISRFLPTVPLVSHDWWIYILLSACGAQLVYDQNPWVQYRQHRANAMGMNTSWPQKWRRIQKLWAGDFRAWNDQHVLALQRISAHLEPMAQQILEQFASARQASLIMRTWKMRQAGVYRQTTLGNLGLWFAILTGKI
jgi:glycosyltransferase involved in cell wall biosynthesis